MDIERVQQVLSDQDLDGWLFADHHGRDPIARRLLVLPQVERATRHWYYFIPREGEPVALVSAVEPEMLDGLPGVLRQYNGWEAQRNELCRLLTGRRIVAMQYSPECRMPNVSTVDCGTIELVRSTGVAIISSDRLVQAFDARLTGAQLETHLAAGRKVDSIRRSAFVFVADRLRVREGANEWTLVEFVRTAMEREGLVSSGGPLVAVNRNISLPHYQPCSWRDAKIRAGDLVLLDIWAKLDQPDAVYYDTAWMASCGADAAETYDRLFDVVVQARDAATAFVSERLARREPVKAYAVDDVARGLIRDRGHADAFVHRLGHSLGTDVHGSGANLDNLETHDDRELLPDTLYAVEPGIYFSDFGVRSEYNIFVDDSSARVTGEIQNALLRLH